MALHLMIDVLSKSFTDLIPLQMLVLYASLVVSESFYCYPLFSLVEAFGGDRAVWQEDHHHYTPHTTECTDNQKLKFPRRQACFDMANTGRRQLVPMPRTWKCLPVA